jgi:hypothetical protein
VVVKGWGVWRGRGGRRGGGCMPVLGGVSGVDVDVDEDAVRLRDLAKTRRVRGDNWGASGMAP